MFTFILDNGLCRLDWFDRLLGFDRLYWFDRVFGLYFLWARLLRLGLFGLLRNDCCFFGENIDFILHIIDLDDIFVILSL